MNLETIKGIENVIEEQTEMYMERQNGGKHPARVEEEFLNLEKADSKSRLLDINIEAIMDHLYKIKVFAAWKKSLKKKDLTTDEWKKFNKNV